MPRFYVLYSFLKENAIHFLKNLNLDHHKERNHRPNLSLAENNNKKFIFNQRLFNNRRDNNSAKVDSAKIRQDHVVVVKIIVSFNLSVIVLISFVQSRIYEAYCF